MARECLQPFVLSAACGGGARLQVHCQLRVGHEGLHRFIEMSAGETSTLTLEWRGSSDGDLAELPPVKSADPV
jgi:hypothetical protein